MYIYCVKLAILKFLIVESTLQFAATRTIRYFSIVPSYNRLSPFVQMCYEMTREFSIATGSTLRTNVLSEVEKRAFKIAIIEIRARASFSSFEQKSSWYKNELSSEKMGKSNFRSEEEWGKPRRPFCMNIENVENFEPSRTLPGVDHKGKNPK